MKNEFEILYAYDLNEDIIQGINFIFSEIAKKLYDVEPIVLSEFKESSPLYIEDIQEIEEAIQQASFVLYKPDGFTEKKEWYTSDKILDRHFDFTDYNRWLANINLFKDFLKEYHMFWNEKISKYNWNETSEIEWSDRVWH